VLFLAPSSQSSRTLRITKTSTGPTVRDGKWRSMTAIHFRVRELHTLRLRLRSGAHSAVESSTYDIDMHSTLPKSPTIAHVDANQPRSVRTSGNSQSHIRHFAPPDINLQPILSLTDRPSLTQYSIVAVYHHSQSPPKLYLSIYCKFLSRKTMFCSITSTAGWSGSYPPSLLIAALTLRTRAVARPFWRITLNRVIQYL
jgi:hypothetical protein